MMYFIYQITLFLSKPRSEKFKRKSGGIGFFVHNSLRDKFQILHSKCEYIFLDKS